MERKEKAIVELEDIFKVCEGCRTNGKVLRHDNSKSEWRRVCIMTYPILSTTEQCPCLTCLIKGMCLSGCDDFRNYGALLKRRGYGK